MDLTAAIAAVESNDAFKQFSKEHPKAYFAHAFSMVGPEDDFEWQLGYYAPDTRKLTVFKTVPVEKLPADDAYTEATIKRLDMATVTVQPMEARRITLAAKQEKFPAELITKIILILQHLDRPLYNVTLVTMTFNIFNARIDAATGEIMSSEMRSIMSLRRDT